MAVNHRVSCRGLPRFVRGPGEVTVMMWTAEMATETAWFVRLIRPSGDKRRRIVERSPGLKTKIADDEWYDPLV